MKTVPLRTHELAQTDYSQLELELQRRGAVLAAGVQTYTTPLGAKHARLTDPVLSFDETQTDVAALRRLIRTYGFETR
jgi:hypothetical protein